MFSDLFFYNADDLIAITADLIGYVAAIIIVIGVIHGLFLLVQSLFKGADGGFHRLRIVLGHYLLLGLEFLIGKDILQSILDPTLVELGQLAVLVVIRVVLNYFLVLDVEGHGKLVPKMLKKKRK